MTKWQDSLTIQAAVPTELPEDCIVSTDTDGAWKVPRSIANASSLDGTTGDDLAQDLVDRGWVTCTATDEHDTAHGAPRNICNKWRASVLTEGLQ